MVSSHALYSAQHTNKKSRCNHAEKTEIHNGIEPSPVFTLNLKFDLHKIHVNKGKRRLAHFSGYFTLNFFITEPFLGRIFDVCAKDSPYSYYNAFGKVVCFFSVEFEGQT